jgi:hypothetical protein
MKNRWLLNLALVVLVGALALVAVLKPGIDQPPPGQPLTALTADEIQRIRLQRPQQPEIVLEKSGDRWQLRAPRPARTNGFRINELTRLASTPVTTRFPAPPDGLGRYGLDRPVAAVFLNDLEIRIGALHPLNNEAYVLHAGHVHLLPAATVRVASAPLEDLLSPSLLEDKTKIRSLRLPGFSLKQNEQGAWTRSPELKALTSDRINRFVDEWRYARALSVAAYSGKPARDRIAIEVDVQGRPRTLEFGVLARKPELVLVRFDEQLEYHFPDDAVNRLLELQPDPEPPAAPAAASK